MARLGRHSGFIVAAYAFFVTMLGTTLPTPLYPLLQERYSFGELLTTVIYAIYAIGVVAGLILFGALSDAIGRKPLLLAGLALSALSALLFLVATSLAPIVAARVVSGFSAGMYTGTATAYLVDLAPEHRRRFASLLAVIVNLCGLGAGALLSGLAAAYGSSPLRLPFAIDLALVAIAAASLAFAPETVRQRKHGFQLQRLGVPHEMRGVFVRSATAGFAASAVAGVFSSVVPVFLGHTLDEHSPVLAGGIVFVFMEMALVGQLIVRRLGESAALATGCACLMAGALLLAAGVALESLAATIASSVLAGIGQGVAFGAALAAINLRAPVERRGETASSFFVVAYVGLSVPVIGCGLAIDATSLRAAASVFCLGVAALVAVVLVSQLRVAARRPAGEPATASGDAR